MVAGTHHVPNPPLSWRKYRQGTRGRRVPLCAFLCRATMFSWKRRLWSNHKYYLKRENEVHLAAEPFYHMPPEVIISKKVQLRGVSEG